MDVKDLLEPGVSLVKLASACLGALMPCPELQDFGHEVRNGNQARGHQVIDGVISNKRCEPTGAGSDGAAHNLHHDQRKRTVEVLTGLLNTL